MKSFMHSDYWVEIPEGEFQAGLTSEQQERIWRICFDKAGYQSRPATERAMMDAWLVRLKAGEEIKPVETDALNMPFIPTYKHIPARTVYIKRFYIAQFPLTSWQIIQLADKRDSLYEVPGVWDVPALPGYNLEAHKLSPEEAVSLCEKHGFRFPNSDEWEKAARGTDGRLYTWGNEWDERRGYFYRSQPNIVNRRERSFTVDLLPDTVSPYGVWAMMGSGMPEMVSVLEPNPPYQKPLQLRGQSFHWGLKGTHLKGIFAEYAWEDHILAHPGSGLWMTFRPVIDDLSQLEPQ